MTWLRDILPYATWMSVLIAMVFGILTVWQWSRTRTLSAALELVHWIQTPEFTRSIPLILALPEKTDPARLAGDRELLNAAYAVSHVFESLGVLVFYHLLPLHLVDRLVGGYARECWRRLEPHAAAQRASLGPMFGEWFQWLVERLQEQPAHGKDLGAPAAHAAWRAGRLSRRIPSST